MLKGQTQVEIAKHVLDLLLMREVPMHMEDMIEAADGDELTVRAVVDELRERGEVEELEDDHWRLTARSRLMPFRHGQRVVFQHPDVADRMCFGTVQRLFAIGGRSGVIDRVRVWADSGVSYVLMFDDLEVVRRHREPAAAAEDDDDEVDDG